MPNFLWRQVISLFLVGILSVGPIGSAPSYTPIFFFQGNGSRVGGWVGDLAPKFGWIWMKISSKISSQGWLPSHWGHQLSVGLFGRWFRWYRKRGWLKSNGNSTSWEVLKFETFWEDWLGRSGIWKLLRICWGKCPIGMDTFQHFWWYENQEWDDSFFLRWQLFGCVEVFASLNPYLNMEDVPFGCHQGFLISSLRFGTSEKGKAFRLRNRKLGRPLPLRSDAICCGPFRCSASALLFFLGQSMENCDATTENNPQILVVDIRFFLVVIWIGWQWVLGIIGPPKWISTKYDQFCGPEMVL